MKIRDAFIPALAVVVAVGFLGCTDAKKEQAAKEQERQRLELERQAQADAAKANKAITTNNQKMFSRMNASSPGGKAPENAPSTETSAPKK